MLSSLNRNNISPSINISLKLRKILIKNVLNIYIRVRHIQLIAIVVILLVCQYSLFTDISMFQITAPILVYHRTKLLLYTYLYLFSSIKFILIMYYLDKIARIITLYSFKI